MIGLRAYARHRAEVGLDGGTLRSVQDAIADGRLSSSLTPDRKKIAAADLADKEWLGSTNADRVPVTNRRAQDPATANPLAVARARRELAQAEWRELELSRHRGELVPAKEFEASLSRLEERTKVLFTRCRNKLLAIAARCRQRDPTLTVLQARMIDEYVREALTDLAHGGDDDVG